MVHELEHFCHMFHKYLSSLSIMIQLPGNLIRSGLTTDRLLILTVLTDQTYNQSKKMRKTNCEQKAVK